MNVIIILLYCFWTVCFASNSCYECDPMSQEQCISKNPKHINDCTQPSPIENEPVEDLEIQEYNCVSYYAKDEAEKHSGYYRHCIPKGKSCNTIRQETNKAVIFCKICEMDNCNTDNFSPKSKYNANSEVCYSFILGLTFLSTLVSCVYNY